MKILSIVTLILLTQSVFALDDQQITELIENHSIAGHMTEKEVDDHKFELINSRSYQLQFNTHVRGVASQFNEPENTLDLKNPVIEISVD